MRFELGVNGAHRQIDVDPGTVLAELLAEGLGLGSVRRGCEGSECGSCTVLVDGKPARSCSLLAAQVQAKEVTTVEGLVEGGTPHRVQVAFARSFAIQCGYCTPGMIMVVVALLASRAHPTSSSIREALGGNYCRCSGYEAIVDAALDAADHMRTPNVPPRA